MSDPVQWVPLSSVLETIVDNRGKTVPTSDSGLPLIATNCIKETSIYPTLENVRYVDDETLRTWFRAHLKPNDILFVNKGTPGRVCLVPDPVTFCAAQDMVGFRVDSSKIDYRYLFAFLRSDWVKQTIANNHVGLVIPHFRKQDLDTLSVPLREMKDQQMIGGLYLLLSEKIELNQRMNEELEGMAKLLYDYWFVQYDFPMSAAQAAALGKPHLTGHPYRASGGPMTYHETLKREIPKGWSLTTIGAFSDNFDSKRIPLSKAEREKRPGTIPYYGATEVMDHIDDFIFEGDHVLVAEDGSVMDDAGFPVTQFICGKTWVNNHAHVLRAKDPDNNEFLLHSIKRIPVINIMTGSIQKKITQDNLNAVPMANPTSDCLKAFSKVANNLRKQRINLDQQTQELTTLRDWLLPMLMNGQVSVG